MKKIIAVAVLTSIFIFTASNSVAGKTLSGDEWKATFCNKTTEGENLKSGWTFKVYVNESCDRFMGKFLTGDRAGESFDRPLRVMGSGDICITRRNGKDLCWKVEPQGNDVFHRIGFSNGKHFVTDRSPVEGKQY